MPSQNRSPQVIARNAQATIAQKIERLARRVDRTIAQCRRFERLAQSVAPWATRWPTSSFERLLDVGQSSTSVRNRALVALALKATSDAGAVLDGYDPTEVGEEHELFYQVVRIEWEQRSAGGRQTPA